jgi:site-specific recombinase XerD
VHLNEEAKALLRQFHSWERSVWVFPSQTLATHVNSDNFSKRVYKRAVQAAGLEGVTWHTLRHTFASRLAMSGATD